MRSLLLTIALAIGTAGAAELRITVYDHASLPKGERESVHSELWRIMRKAGITLEWVEGDSNAFEARHLVYTNPPEPGEEFALECPARRDIALEIAPKGSPSRPRALGFAHPWAAAGPTVVVYADRIGDIAAGLRQPLAPVVAHAVAHEIGHVLLRDSGHSNEGGLMASRWTDWEYRLLKDGMLLFDRKQSHRMRETIEGRSCEGITTQTARR